AILTAARVGGPSGGLGPCEPRRQLGRRRLRLPGGSPRLDHADGPAQEPRFPPCPSSRPAQVGQARATAGEARSPGQRLDYFPAGDSRALPTRLVCDGSTILVPPLRKEDKAGMRK